MMKCPNCGCEQFTPTYTVNGVHKFKCNNCGLEFLDVEVLIDDSWKEVRIKAAIAAMQGFIAKPGYIGSYQGVKCEDSYGIAKLAVKYADALVEELKNNAL